MSGRCGFRVRGEQKTGWESRGGYMEAKVQKLEQQFEEDSEGRNQLSSIFRGVTIQVNGLTHPSADELKMIMSKHGGKYHMYYSRSKTTHVIASNLPHAKRKELRPDQKVVKPQWIVDSLKAKELLPIEPYLVVPLDNGSQNRISSLLGKRRSTDSDTPSTSAGSRCSSAGMSSETQQEETSDLPPQKVANKTLSSICPTTDSNFLQEFYSHSRLHFLSTWKMELTDYVRSLQTEESLKEIPLSGYQKLTEISQREGSMSTSHGRMVMHIDMDCFFVSVGLLSRPELKGLPVAVTHSSGSGNTRERPGSDPDYERQFYENKYNKQKDNTEGSAEQDKTKSWVGFSASTVASCSYEARAAGIKNGMFFGKAKQLCPELRAIPYDFEAYRKASQQLYSTLASYTRHIEAVSCDEALVDITKLVRETGLPPLRVASCIRHSVKEATQCNASAGVGPNIALARMATRRAKPDGEYVVTQDEAKEFMHPLPVKDLPGVGYSTASRLQELGVVTCGDLQNFSIENLKREFGNKTGQKLHDMSFGIDLREVQNEKERKSVSAEVNYGIRLSNEEEAKTFLRNLAQEVMKRLKSTNMRGRKVTLKVMTRRADAPPEAAKYGGHGVCDSASRSCPISNSHIEGPLCDDDTDVIFEAVWSMLRSLKLNVEDLRGVGIQVTQLQPAESSSKTAESSSAAFLKKFVKKKSEIQTTEAKEMSTASNSTDYDASSSSVPPSKDEIKEETSDVANNSFLDALPPDLRKEVEKNFAQQKRALERNYNIDESSNSSVPDFPSVSVESSPKRNVPNVLFCGRGKLSAGTRATSKSSKSMRGKGRGRKGLSKTKPQKSSNKITNRKPSIVGTSPNKLITDMFPVTYSPRKTNSPLVKTTFSPMRSKASSSAVQRVKRVLVPQVAETPIQILDSEDDEDIKGEENITEAKQEEKEDKESVPSLGGAITIQEVRQALSEWMDAFATDGPLECDVDDFITFLSQTATKVRNLEKVHLIMRSFRRKLLSLLNQENISENKFDPNHIWVQIYDYITQELQIAVSTAYNGGELNILPLDAL